MRRWSRLGPGEDLSHSVSSEGADSADRAVSCSSPSSPCHPPTPEALLSSATTDTSGEIRLSGGGFQLSFMLPSPWGLGAKTAFPRVIAV